MEFLSFFRGKIIPGIALFIGPLIAVGSLMLHALTLLDMRLPIEIWVSIGLIIFFSGSIGVIYKSLNASRTPSRRLSARPTQSNELSALAASILPTDDEILVPQDVYPEFDNSPSIKFKRKLRVVVRNESGRYVTVRAATWQSRTGDIGVRPLPNYVWQTEDGEGWERNNWSAESHEVSVAPGKVLRTWIGLHDAADEIDVRRRHETRRLGTLVIPMIIEGKNTCQRISL